MSAPLADNGQPAPTPFDARTIPCTCTELELCAWHRANKARIARLHTHEMAEWLLDELTRPDGAAGEAR